MTDIADVELTTSASSKAHVTDSSVHSTPLFSDISSTDLQDETAVESDSDSDADMFYRGMSNVPAAPIMPYRVPVCQGPMSRLNLREHTLVEPTTGAVVHDGKPFIQAGPNPDPPVPFNRMKYVRNERSARPVSQKQDEETAGERATFVKGVELQAGDVFLDSDTESSVSDPESSDSEQCGSVGRFSGQDTNVGPPEAGKLPPSPAATSSEGAAADKSPREAQFEEATAENAQAIYSPDACIFVANLSTGHTTEELTKALQKILERFGKVYINVRRDRRSGNPYAHCQFTDKDDAHRAVVQVKDMEVLGRPVRTEHARANRALFVSMHTGQDVDRADILRIVTPFGPLEKDWFASETDREVYQLSKGMFIRFSFFTDCRKAEQALRHHPAYRFEFVRDQTKYKVNKGVEHFPNTEMVFKMANRTSNGPTVLVKEPYNTALFIGDLAPSVTQATVTEACAALPGFMFVVFKAGAASHIPGHATVYFEDSIDTQRAYNQLRGRMVIHGRPVRVEFARKDRTRGPVPMRLGATFPAGPQTPLQAQPYMHYTPPAMHPGNAMAFAQSPMMYSPHQFNGYALTYGGYSPVAMPYGTVGAANGAPTLGSPFVYQPSHPTPASSEHSSNFQDGNGNCQSPLVNGSASAGYYSAPEGPYMGWGAYGYDAPPEGHDEHCL